MKRYLAIVIASFAVPFAACWLFVALEFPRIGSSEYWLDRAHVDEIAKCDLGDIAIVGDSTSLAGIMPARIGQHVKNFGLSGGSPLSGYYISQAMLKCPRLPKAIILAFVAGNFSSTPSRIANPSDMYWNTVKFGIIKLPDSLEVRELSRALGDTQVVGMPSLLDIDYRIKTALYAIKFPPLYVSELADFAEGTLLRRAASAYGKNLAVYRDAVRENGHHFMGTDADGGIELDSDIDRHGSLVSNLQAFYVKQTIESFTNRGIKVYFVEPPRDRDSVIHYNPSTITQYQEFLTNLERNNPNFRVIDGGFHTWSTMLFGDPRHLNFRGAMILSDDVRKALYENGLDGMVYSAPVVSANLYGNELGDPASLRADGGDVTPVSGIAPPALAYAPLAPAIFKFVAAGSSANASSTLDAPTRNLVANTNYSASAFIKNDGASNVSLRLRWPKEVDGSVTWDFAKHKILYSGGVTAINGGVTVCPGGWVHLFISGITGPSGGHPGPAVIVPGKVAAVYLYNVVLEKSVWPTNYCAVQAGETETVELHQNQPRPKALS